MAEAKVDDLKFDPGIHDVIFCILLRELFTFEQLKSISRSGNVRIVRTKKGHILRLQGQKDDRVTVELDYTQSKAPRLFCYSLSELQDVQERMSFDQAGNILPAVIDVSD